MLSSSHIIVSFKEGTALTRINWLFRELELNDHSYLGLGMYRVTVPADKEAECLAALIKEEIVEGAELERTDNRPLK